MTNTCTIDGCEKLATRANDLCHMHYDRLLRTGDPLKGGKNELWDRIKAELPGEAKQIAERLGVPHRSVIEWLRKKRDATPKEVYIRKWRKPDGKGKNVPTYALGSRPDAQCELARLSRKVVYQRWRDKAEKTGAMDRVRARQLARYYEGRAKSRKATWASALGVMA